LSIYLILK